MSVATIRTDWCFPFTPRVYSLSDLYLQRFWTFYEWKWRYINANYYYYLLLCAYLDDQAIFQKLSEWKLLVEIGLIIAFLKFSNTTLVDELSWKLSDHKHTLVVNGLTLPMLRLLSSKAQGHKDFRNTSKPCHVGIHWKALAKYFQMSTHMPGFWSFFRFLALFCIGQISHQQHKG